MVCMSYKPATNKDTYTAMKSALDVAWKNELIEELYCYSRYPN